MRATRQDTYNELSKIISNIIGMNRNDESETLEGVVIRCGCADKLVAIRSNLSKAINLKPEQELNFDD